MQNQKLNLSQWDHGSIGTPHGFITRYYIQVYKQIIKSKQLRTTKKLADIANRCNELEDE